MEFFSLEHYCIQSNAIVPSAEDYYSSSSGQHTLPEASTSGSSRSSPSSSRSRRPATAGRMWRASPLNAPYLAEATTIHQELLAKEQTTKLTRKTRKLLEKHGWKVEDPSVEEQVVDTIARQLREKAGNTKNASSSRKNKRAATTQLRTQALSLEEINTNLVLENAVQAANIDRLMQELADLRAIASAQQLLIDTQGTGSDADLRDEVERLRDVNEILSKEKEELAVGYTELLLQQCQGL